MPASSTVTVRIVSCQSVLECLTTNLLSMECVLVPTVNNCLSLRLTHVIVPAPGSVILHGRTAVVPLWASTSPIGPSRTSSFLPSGAFNGAIALLALEFCWCFAWLTVIYMCISSRIIRSTIQNALMMIKKYLWLSPFLRHASLSEQLFRLSAWNADQLQRHTLVFLFTSCPIADGASPQHTNLMHRSEITLPDLLLLLLSELDCHSLAQDTREKLSRTIYYNHTRINYIINKILFCDTADIPRLWDLWKFISPIISTALLKQTCHATNWLRFVYFQLNQQWEYINFSIIGFLYGENNLVEIYSHTVQII